MRTCLVLFLLAALGFSAEKKVRRADLPPAVQQTVQELEKTATLVGLSKEVEDGKTTYEAETKINGKTRDVSIAADGKIIGVEEETALDQVPGAVRAAIEKEVAGGKLTRVEKITDASGEVHFEAAITPKSGKKKELLFRADGTLIKR